MALKAKWRRFVEEYLVDFNATQAYIRAGYSPKGADASASKLLVNPSIQEAIATGAKKVTERTEVTQDMIANELRKIGFLDPRKVMKWGPDGVEFTASDQLDDDDAICIIEASQTTTKDGGTIRVKFADKIKALELLGKRFGMFTDKLEVSTDPKKPRVIEIVIEHHSPAENDSTTSGDHSGETTSPIPSGTK